MVNSMKAYKLKVNLSTARCTATLLNQTSTKRVCDRANSLHTLATPSEVSGSRPWQVRRTTSVVPRRATRKLCDVTS